MMGEQSGGGEGTHLGPERVVLFPVEKAGPELSSIFKSRLELMGSQLHFRKTCAF